MILSVPDEGLIERAKSALQLHDTDVRDWSPAIQKMVRLLLLCDDEDRDNDKADNDDDDEEEEEEIAQVHATRLAALEELQSNPPILTPVRKEGESVATLLSFSGNNVKIPTAEAVAVETTTTSASPGSPRLATGESELIRSSAPATDAIVIQQEAVSDEEKESEDDSSIASSEEGSSVDSSYDTDDSTDSDSVPALLNRSTTSFSDDSSTDASLPPLVSRTDIDSSFDDRDNDVNLPVRLLPGLLGYPTAGLFRLEVPPPRPHDSSDDDVDDEEDDDYSSVESSVVTSTTCDSSTTGSSAPASTTIPNDETPTAEVVLANPPGAVSLTNETGPISATNVFVIEQSETTTTSAEEEDESAEDSSSLLSSEGENSSMDSVSTHSPSVGHGNEEDATVSTPYQTGTPRRDMLFTKANETDASVSNDVVASPDQQHITTPGPSLLEGETQPTSCRSASLVDEALDQPDPPGLRTQSDPPGNHVASTTADADITGGTSKTKGGSTTSACESSALTSDCEEWKISDADQKLLHESAFGNLHTIQELLSSPDGGANLNATDRSGRTCLYYAIVNDYVEVVHYLVSAGASVLVQDKSGQSPLHLREAYQSLEMARILLEKDRSLVNLPDKEGLTPLWLASSSGRWDVVNLMARQHDANVSAMDRETGTTLLHLACSANSHNHTNIPVVKIVQMLVEKGADPNKQDLAHMQAPLHRAVISYASRDVFKVLLNHGADVNLQDKDGKTPLSLARDKRRTWEVKLMESHCCKTPFLVAGYKESTTTLPHDDGDDDDETRLSPCVAVPVAPSEWATSPMEEDLCSVASTPPCRAVVEEIPTATKAKQNRLEHLLELKRLKLIEVQQAMDIAKVFCPVGNKYNTYWKKVFEGQAQGQALDLEIERLLAL